jgi:hypothetical protein
MITLLASLVALAVIGACVPGPPRESNATRLTRGVLAAVAALVAVQLVLGALGWLFPGITLLALLAVAGPATLWRRRRPEPPPQPREPWTRVDSGLAVALAAAFVLRLHAGLDKTTFLYDTLSYHLHAPATWMHEGRLAIVPSPFGDPAPAYAPANLELVFQFLMAPLRSDALAGVGQLPFAALAATAIAAAVREAGGTRAAALSAALAFLLIPEVWTQAPAAMTDLGLAAFALASLPFATRLFRDGTRVDAATAGVALGLAVGTKYVGALMALPFLVTAGLALGSRRIDWRATSMMIVPIAVLGGVWYLRNLIVTGNPFYPVAAFGFAGLYDRAAMRAWDYHLPVTQLGELSELLLASGVGFASAAGVALARGWRGRESMLALALVALFWFVVPYQESRFLFPAFGVAAVALGRQAERAPIAVGRGALVVALATALLAWPTPERLALVPVAAAGALALPLSSRAPAALRSIGAGVAAAALLVAVGAGVTRWQRRDPGYAVDDGTRAAWRWFRAHVRDRRVAYTGTNLAFPLAGERLANRVAYVNVAGAPDDRLHDFGRRSPGPCDTRRAAPNCIDNPEPAPYRDGANAAVWLANLRAARTEILFVAALYPIVRRVVAADADGFPIERAWADARPAQFHLRYASAAARVYEVAP